MTRNVPHIAPASCSSELDPRRLLTRSEVSEIFGLSHRWLEVSASRGDGPPMVRLSSRMVRYRLRDVEAWISAHVDQKEDKR